MVDDNDDDDNDDNDNDHDNADTGRLNERKTHLSSALSVLSLLYCGAGNSGAVMVVVVVVASSYLVTYCW